MKKSVRFLLIALGGLVAVLAVAVGLALHSGVQTWAARRALASQSGLKAQLGSLSAGFQTVDLKDLNLERDGAVIALPSFHAELSVIAAGLSQKISVRKLVAKGWTLDLRKFKFPAKARQVVLLQTEGGSRPFSLLPSAYAADSAAAAAATKQVFEGIFAQSALPCDLALDGVDLEGDVLLPSAPGVDTGRAHLVLAGGGFTPGKEGALSFNVSIAVTAADLPVNTLEVSGRIAATMDTPRTFLRLGTKADAAATGPQFPRGVKLSADVSALRDPAGENYSLTLAGEGRQLVTIQATFPKATRKLDGTWKLDARDTDLTPFALGRALPVFAATGEGRFDTDPAFGGVHATGKIDASADRLAVVRPELAALGALQLRAEFDVAQRGDVVRVERLTAAVAGAQPVARVWSLQTFELNVTTRELKVADPAKELLGLALDGLPLAWAQPWLKDVAVTGGNLRGEFAATARNDGLTLRAKAPLTAAGVSVTRAGQPVLRAVDLSLFAAADYAPQGWQAEVAPLIVRSGEAALLTLEARAGQLAGRDQPLKVAGKFSSQLPAALAQPFAGGAAQLVAGEAAGTFAAESLGPRQAVQAAITLSNLAADPKLTKETLPTISADLRADMAADGPINLNVPVLVERAGRKSDLTLAGTLTPGKGGLAVNAQVTSALLVVDDAKILAAPLAPAAEAKESGTAGKPATRPAAPPWAGVSGQLSLALKKVVYSEKMQVSDVAGTIRIDAGAVKIVNGRAGLGSSGDAKISGGLTFDGKAPKPFALAADLAVMEFDPAPLFQALNPGQPATVEGKFSVASKLAGEAMSLADLATSAHGDFQLTSKGGVFRGLPVNYSAKVETTGKLAAGVAAVGSFIGSMTGKKEVTDVATKAQAVSDISKLLAAIQYDQLSVVLARDAALNTVVKDFTLISPEMRLTGSGTTTHQPDRALLDDALALEFKLRARGRTAELLKYLGKLDAQADELGYAACTLPLKVGGTLANVDTSELNSALATLGVEKSGALELFNKLIPGSGK